MPFNLGCFFNNVDVEYSIVCDSMVNGNITASSSKWEFFVLNFDESFITLNYPFPLSDLNDQ